MITKIKTIKNLGLFSNYTWDSDLCDFGRYNLVYGWNGSGKTTLSKLFARLENLNSPEFPDLKYDIEHENGNCKENVSLPQNIRVFNQDYIQKNVNLASGTASPIFILGEENKKIADQIKGDEETLYDLERQKKSKETERDGKINERSHKFTEVARSISAISAGLSTRTYRKPNAEHDFEKLTEKKILNDEQISKQGVVINQEQKENTLKIKFEIDLDLTVLYDEISNICKETVEINVINRLDENHNISDWVEKGLSLHTIESKKCEFCNSAMPHGRIQELLEHFNEADKKLKQKIDNKISILKKNIETIKRAAFPHKAQFYTDLQNKFTSAETSYNQEKRNYFAELSLMIDILNTKKQKTTELVHFSKTLSNNFQSAFNSVNELVGQHNKKSNNFQIEKEHAFELLKNHRLSEIYDEVATLDEAIGKDGEEINKLENGDGKGTLIGITALKHRIEENKKTISPEHKACGILNIQLQTFLGRNEILFEVSLEERGYAIKRNNTTAKSLSESEKTAIAFVYFVVSLEDQDFNLNNGIVVVDDPVSSLDSGSLFQAFAFLKNAVKDAEQVFILTHNFDFLKLALNWLKSVGGGHKKYYMIKNKYSETNSRTACIAKLDKELKDHESEYHYLFKILYTFKTDGSIGSVYHMPNIARKTLETFLMFRVPTNENLYKKMQKLTFDENKKTAILDFFNDQSHMTGSGLDSCLAKKVRKNVDDLLEMMKATFPEHYQILEDQFKSNQT